MSKSGIKYNTNFYLQALMFILLFIILGCDAPRINPFDPENPDYAFVTLQGTVKTLSSPNKSISGAIVIWSPVNIIVYTDKNGTFNINNLLPVNGKLIIQKSGYQTDTVNVVWGNSKLLNYQISLK